MYSPAGGFGRVIGGAWRPKWSEILKTKLGGFLVAKLIDVAEIQSAEPKGILDLEDKFVKAFFHRINFIKDKKIGVIVYSDELAKVLSEKSLKNVIDPRMLPMLARPNPWTSWNKGGYLENDFECIRIKNSPEHRDYIRAADLKNHLSTVYAALDVLGETGWRINRRVYDVVERVWRDELGLSDVPGKEPVAPVIPAMPVGDDAPEEKKRISKLKIEWKQEKAKWYSKKCDTNYKIEIARAVRPGLPFPPNPPYSLNLPQFLGQTMYFPHNIDFRGRAYPMPAHLNHIGNDLCRGLMLFEKARPLGDQGLRWMKVQLANVFGMDKASFQNRVLFVDEHVKDIMDSADRPLEVRLPGYFFFSTNKVYLRSQIREIDGGSRPKTHGSVSRHVWI